MSTREDVRLKQVCNVFLNQMLMKSNGWYTSCLKLERRIKPSVPYFSV